MEIICYSCHKSFTLKYSRSDRQPKFCSMKCFGYSIKGSNNRFWKGDDAKYLARHIWVYKNFGKADNCESDTCSKESIKYEWANISGKYIKERKDWIKLCKKCHIILDKQYGPTHGNYKHGLAKNHNAYYRHRKDWYRAWYLKRKLKAAAKSIPMF